MLSFAFTLAPPYIKVQEWNNWVTVMENISVLLQAKTRPDQPRRREDQFQYRRKCVGLDIGIKINHKAVCVKQITEETRWLDDKEASLLAH